MTRWVPRRTFLYALSLVAVILAGFCLSHVAKAEQSTAPRRIGVLVVSFSPESKEAQAFRQGLRDAGYTEGRDLVLEWRFSAGNYDLVPRQAAELVQSNVDLIVADTTVAAQAAKRATSTIPIVMAFVADPISAGLVGSLAHPGGNITGLSMMIPDVSAKRLQLLKEIVPRLARVSVLWNPNSPFHAKVIEELKVASPTLAIDLNFISVQKPEDIEPGFQTAIRAHADALYIIEEPVIYTNRKTLLDLLAKARLPAIFPVRQFVVDGGLVCYGTNFEDLFRRSAGYVDKILKGGKPGTLPVEQPVKFDLVVNLKTAKALGLTIPQTVMVQATEVIR